jgi:hypothetical protein
VAGQRLSVRDIELLAQVTSGARLRCGKRSTAGKLGWSLEQMKRVPEDREGCNEFERVLLGDLQILQKLMQRVMAKCHDPRCKSRPFTRRPTC